MALTPLAPGMPAPTLSVLMTVYNGERYLAETLDSILGQTFTDFEFLVIDDGSTDQTGPILARMAEQDARLQLWHNERNLGIARSMNKLWPLARGRYLTRHDADDLSRRDRFERQVAYLETNPELGLVGSFVQVIDAGGRSLDIDSFASGADNDSLQRQLLLNNCLGQGAVMFRRECRDAVGEYDESLANTEDYDFWLRLAEITRLAKVPERLYYYRHHPASVSNAHRSPMMLHQAQALQKAVLRRFGPEPAADQRLIPLPSYLLAVSMALADRESLIAQESLAGALRLCPEFFAASSPEWPVPPSDEGIALAEAAFANLPPTRPYVRLARHLRSRLHIDAMFVAAGRRDFPAIRAHVWPGLVNNPRWLFNRGVLVLMAKSWLARVMPGPAVQPGAKKDKTS